MIDITDLEKTFNSPYRPILKEESKWDEARVKLSFCRALVDEIIKKNNPEKRGRHDSFIYELEDIKKEWVK